MKDLDTRKEKMSRQWYDAVEKYGEDEAKHIVAELWGLSYYRIDKEVARLEEDLWL
jgi:hypothetical protein|tara:strand:+ start:139 stop:306 length:168 start_codon:yes stop_codon:yes gene_type:complete